MIRAERVSKALGHQFSLGPISLSCPSEKTTVLIGPSGCGKSTFLRLLVGLLWPEQGRIEFSGTTVNRQNIGMLRRQIGYVTQDGGLFPHLTAMSNIMLASKAFGLEALAQSRIGPLVTMTGLSDELLSRYPSELSSGQRQRVSLVRALVLNPSYLLLDEPMGALDPMIRADLQKDLKAICQGLKMTVVCVTHDLSEAAFLGDKVVLMQGGKVSQEGALSQLMQNPRNDFVVKFLAAQHPFHWTTRP